MGYDLIVWNSENRLTNDEANCLYGRICGQEANELLQSDRINDFYRELTAKFPEIDGFNDSPWSGAIENAGAYVRLECVWSRADEIDFEVRSLAAQFGLAVFDPQRIEVVYPDDWNPT